MLNLVGRDDCDVFIREELSAAGLPVIDLPRGWFVCGEVSWACFSAYEGWTFARRWVYWVAECNSGEPVGEEAARTLNQQFRQTLRVDGYVDGRDISEPVSIYHADTPEALRALRDFLYERDRNKQVRP